MAWLDKLYCTIEEWKELIIFLHKNKRKIFKKTNIKYPLNWCYWIVWEEQNIIVFNNWRLLDIYIYRYSWIKHIKKQLEEKYSLNFLKNSKINKQKVSWRENVRYYGKWYDLFDNIK